MAKIGRVETEKAVIDAMEKAGKPVTVAYIERQLNLNFRTAHGVLQEMIKRGTVGLVETTGVSFYVLPSWKPDLLPSGKEKIGERERSEKDSFSKIGR